MFHSRITERVNKIHEVALKVVYGDSLYQGFDEILIKEILIRIHKKILISWQMKFVSYGTGYLLPDWITDIYYINPF